MDLLRRVAQYCDAAPRVSATAESCGELVLFVGAGAWSYYARPRLGVETVPLSDVEAVLARQGELQVPQEIEWIAELTPSLAELAEAAGMSVKHHPLLVLESPVEVAAPDGASIRVLTHDDPAVADAMGAVAAAFGGDGSVDPAAVAFKREQIQSGLTMFAAAEVSGSVVGAGSALPRADAAELTGIGVLTDHRRRGIGLALAALLANEVRRRGVQLVFLSAADDAVARIYERAGFRRVGTACAAARVSQ